MSNKGGACAFKSEVIIAFHEAGFSTAARPAEPKGRPDAERVHGDVLGLPWTIAVRNCRAIDLSGAQDEARREAEVEGKELFVSIQARRGHPVEESYATMPLSVLLRVMAQLHPEAVAAGG